jgi:membrane associated rhomboid family serine protease
MGLMVVFYLIGLVPGVVERLAYFPQATVIQPWTMLTYPFVHVSPLSLLLDGLIMFLIGRQIEEMLGRSRFITLFLVSALAGAVAILVFVPTGAVIGAGPVIWGLFGAILIYSRSQGGNVTGLLIMLGLFLVLGFVLNSTWQANVGGLVGGAAVTAVYLRLGAIRQQNQQRLAIAGIVGVLVVIAAFAVMN